MKHPITLLLIAFCLGSISILAQQQAPLKKKKILVRGNCGMCETTIEKAALSIEGVAEAEWELEQELLKVKFDPSVTDTKHIEKAIAASGYDTRHEIAPLDIYENLPACCQYDDKKKEK